MMEMRGNRIALAERGFRRILALLSCLIIVSSYQVGAEDRIEGVKFSKEEIELLRQLDRIQKGAGIAATMLKATPFVQLFSSSKPVEVAVTITTTDWELIFGSLKALKTIKACETERAIDFFEIESRYSSEKSAKFFRAIHRKASEACS